ncbi:O-antigen ligase family protein [Nitrospinaceae bacterium]|nr:O-antigen ligase family protein [Nitrospinaceae bacterium]
MTAILRHLGGVILLLGLILNIKEEEDLQRFLWILLICAGFISLIAIAQQFEVFRAIIPKATRNMSTGFYGHRNILATYLLLHFPLAIYFYFSSQTRNKKIIIGILPILIVLALIFSRSRGGQLVLIVQLFCILIYLVQKKDHDQIKFFLVGGVLTTVLYFGLLFLLKVSAVEQFYSTPPSIANAFTGKLGAWDNFVNRLVYWRTGWEIFKDYWLTGSGPWTFELLFPLYLTSEGFCLPSLTPAHASILGTCQTQGASGLVNGFVDSVNPPHSHNFIIQTATETGVIGLGIFIIFLIAIYSRGINLLRNSPPETRNFVFFLLLSVTGFLIHNQIEYNWIQIHFIYPFIFLVFALDFLDRKYSLKKSSLKKVNSLIQSSVLTAFILVGTLSTVSYYKYQALIYEKIIPGTGVANIRVLTNEAKTYCPGCGWPGLEMTKNLISQYRLTPNHTILESAETELKEVALLTPFNLRQFIYLAEIRSFQKKWDGAKKFYDQAFKNIKMKQLHACRVISSNPDKC